MRQRLLATHIGCEIADKIRNGSSKTLFRHGKSDYLVLTLEEANSEAECQINDMLWSIDTALIQQFLKTEVSIATLKKVQSDMCPNCTQLLLSLLDNPRDFYREVIHHFGRGYFIAFHDKRERIVHEAEVNKRYYIYRLS